jgi:hypothetical protein
MLRWHVMVAAAVAIVTMPACGDGTSPGPRGEGSELPTTTAGAPLPSSSLPLARYGGVIEVGVVYRYPLYVHCGMRGSGN